MVLLLSLITIAENYTFQKVGKQKFSSPTIYVYMRITISKTSLFTTHNSYLRACSCNIKCSLDILFLTLLSLGSGWVDFPRNNVGDSVFFCLDLGQNKTRVRCLHSKIAFAYRNNSCEREVSKLTLLCNLQSREESQTITATHQYNTFLQLTTSFNVFFFFCRSFRPRRHCLADCVTHTHHTRSRFS